MKKLLLSTAAFVFGTSVAVAGTLVEPPIVEITPPPAPTAYDWSGFYLGIQGGMAGGTMEYVPGPPVWTIGQDWMYGGFAGYNFQSGNFVYGAEIGVSLYDGVPNGFTTESFDYLVDARARIGYADDNLLLYAFGGGTIGHYSIPATPDDWPLYGANFGVGAEIGVTDNIVFGAEYIGRYLVGTTATAQTQTNWLHGAQARLSFKF